MFWLNKNLSATRIPTLLTCLFIGFVFSYAAFGASRETVKVIAVIDGDTVRVFHEKNEKVRLASIDAPEMKQPYGQASKKALSRMIYGKMIELERHDVDQYGRTVATLWLNQQDINLEMVAQGHAWVYRRYNRDPMYLVAERQAKGLRKGLWRLPPEQREAPWLWRKKEAQRKQTNFPKKHR